MRRALPLAAAVLLLAGCGGGSPAAPPSSSSSSTSGRSTADMAYLAAVVPHVPGNAEADLIRLGRQACADITRGLSGLSVAETLTAEGFSTEASSAIVAAAQAAYCPGTTGQ